MLSSRQSTGSSVQRDAWVEVDLNALEANVAEIRSWIEVEADHRTVTFMAVVKSDAYGHGALACAEVFVAAGAEWLAVASVDEGVQLRAVIEDIPILVLSPVPTWAIRSAIENQLDMTAVSLDHLRTMRELARGLKTQARVHIKVDTGMHRLGVEPKDVVGLVEFVRESPELKLAGIFSHLAVAEQKPFTQKQADAFRGVLDEVSERFPGTLYADGGETLCHLASGGATKHFAFTHCDMVRIGLHLYGLDAKTRAANLVPALSVRGRVNQIREVQPGDAVGYNLTWTTSRPTKLGSVPIGYADGIDRGLSNKMSGVIMGKRVPQVGIISMDQMLFDLTEVPDAGEGDVITLIGADGGESVGLDEWARTLDTITYELACRLRVRMPRIYTRNLALPPTMNDSKTKRNGA